MFGVWHVPVLLCQVVFAGDSVSATSGLLFLAGEGGLRWPVLTIGLELWLGEDNTECSLILACILH